MEENDLCVYDTFILLQSKGMDSEVCVGSCGRRKEHNGVEILGYLLCNLSLKFLGYYPSH